MLLLLLASERESLTLNIYTEKIIQTLVLLKKDNKTQSSARFLVIIAVSLKILYLERKIKVLVYFCFEFFDFFFENIERFLGNECRLMG
jgi:hypothetical protein